MKKVPKADLGKIIECEECCEKVKVGYPETRPCPKCKRNIKLKAKVCKYCKQRIMPFVDPFEREPAPATVTPPPARNSKINPQIKVFVAALLGLAGGFAAGFYGTHAIAKITRRCITGNADYIVAAILGIYLAVHFYRSIKSRN